MCQHDKGVIRPTRNFCVVKTPLNFQYYTPKDSAVQAFFRPSHILSDGIRVQGVAKGVSNV